MEPLDQHIAEALADSPLPGRSGPARILLVGSDETLRASMTKTLQHRRHRCTCAASLDEARSAIARMRFDLVVLICERHDGDGLELAPLLQKTSPATKLVIVSKHASLETAVQAMRCGAVDYIAAHTSASEFMQRIDAALIKARVDRQREDRLVRLKKICRELNNARHEIAKQVDALCGDLTNAYQGIAEQMNDVAMASEFRTLLRQELDVEDLLRTMLQYLLTKTGPTNAAVFLPDSNGDFGLGAYVNCDCPRETVSVMLDHLCQAICPQMADETEIVSYADAREFSQWIGEAAGGNASGGVLAESQVIAFSCRHRDECMAVIVLFRDRSNPFDAKLGSIIQTLRDIIAEQLANVIRVHHRARPSWPKEAADGDLDFNDDYGFGFEGGLAA